MYHLEIDKSSARPFYLQIKDQLLAAIDQGQFQPGQKIPSARYLSEQIGVSRLTVLQALRELIYQRRLFTVTGKGTFVGRVEKLSPIFAPCGGLQILSTTRDIRRVRG